MKILMLIASLMKNTTNTTNIKNINVLSNNLPNPPNSPILKWILLVIIANVVQPKYCGEYHETSIDEYFFNSCY